MATTKGHSNEPAMGAGENAGFSDNIRLTGEGENLFVRAGVVGLLALVVSLLLGLTRGDGARQFLHSYLVAFMWMLSIGLGALWWVTLQHLVNAKWSIAVRRVGELLAGNMALLAVLSLPIVVPMLLGNSNLYLWVDQQRMHADHLLHHKASYLNLGFFTVRWLGYFIFWTLLARHFIARSVPQDQTGGTEQVAHLRKVSGPAMIALAATLTFAAIDFLMTLDPTWFSTIFGVYFFAGCVVSAHSFFALTLMWLQSKGRLVKSVTVEHYHDIGKMMFAFIVFWSYIGFSQFMLIWYANIPEETHWYKMRFAGDWSLVSWALVFGHFLIPFFGLLSRQIKRNKKTLAFWAVWILMIHWVDMYWLVMPNLSAGALPLDLLDLTCLVGVAGVFIAGIAFQARRVNLLPIKDPRLEKSLAFENI
jgi:hypothetical protein